MKVLLTGGTGQIGRALLATAPGGLDVLAPARGELDLANPVSIKAAMAAHSPDIVINAGAYTAVDKAESEPELASAINAVAPGIFSKALTKQGKGRFIQLSTDFVFDGEANRPYNANDPRNPLSVYGQTKADGEDAAGGDAIILRTSWVYAAGGANFVRTMLRLMRERDELRVVADQVGAPSWAPDIARTIWALAAKNQPGIYHHRDGGETSWHGFAEAIAEEALGVGLLKRAPAIVPILADEYPTPATRPAYSVLDDTGTRELLRDQTAPWRENLQRMLKEEQGLG